MAKRTGNVVGAGAGLPLSFALMTGAVRMGGASVDSRARPCAVIPGARIAATSLAAIPRVFPTIPSMQSTGTTGRFRHTPVTREKISAANKGHVPWNKGRKHSEETKLKISAATKAAMEDPTIRQKLRTNATGRRHTEETKRKIRKATRLKRGTLEARRDRIPVPFRFGPSMVAALDERITKRYQREFVETSYHFSGRPKRPMAESTRRKLSESIRRLWAEDTDYREKVFAGIEQRNQLATGRGLSEEHKKAISRTLREKHAARRREIGLPDSDYRPRSRKPRSRLPINDPAMGTRFADSALSEEDRMARDQRRRAASKTINEAEEKELEEYNLEEKRIAVQRKKQKARQAASEEKKKQETRRANKLLIESLAMAGQLPSLDKECAMEGTTVHFGTPSPWANTASFSADGMLTNLDDLDTDSLPDPDPLAPNTSTTTIGQSSSHDIFGAAFSPFDPAPPSTLAPPSLPSPPSALLTMSGSVHPQPEAHAQTFASPQTQTQTFPPPQAQTQTFTAPQTHRHEATIPFDMPLFQGLDLDEPKPARKKTSKSAKTARDFDLDDVLASPFEEQDTMPPTYPGDENDADDFAGELALLDPGFGGNDPAADEGNRRSPFHPEADFEPRRLIVRYGSSGERELQKVTNL